MRKLADGGGLDLDMIRTLAARPPLYEPGDPIANDWSDPEVAANLLRYHLDYRASLQHRSSQDVATIDRIVGWLMARLDLRAGQRVLDLGCSVGFYARRLSERGLRVTGVDWVPILIEHARRDARERGLPTEYVCQDYRSMDYTAEFDAVLQIGAGFELGVPAETDGFLRLVRRALRPGGRFVAEQMTNTRRWACGSPSWDCVEGPRGTQLVLGQVHDYPEDEVALLQEIVIHHDGAVGLHRAWHRDHTPATATALLRRHGLEVEGCWADPLGRPYEGGNLLVVVARALPGRDGT